MNDQQCPYCDREFERCHPKVGGGHECKCPRHGFVRVTPSGVTQ